MQAGTLRKRITIQSPVFSTNPYDTATSGSWNNVHTCWARIQTVDTRAIQNANVQNMQVSHLITIRYPGIENPVAAGDQILFGTRIFQVLKGLINDEENNRMLQIYAWEINPPQ